MKNKKDKKYISIPQKFEPSQINELSMICVIVNKNQTDELFEYIVDNGGRVVSVHQSHGVSRGFFGTLMSQYSMDKNVVFAVCQSEITDVFMANMCKTFELYKDGNGKAFVIDILGYMGAKGMFVE